MPVYVYTCDACHEGAEYLRKRDEADDVALCDCGETMRRVFTMPRFRVKSAPRDPNDVTRQYTGAKRGEQTYTNPYTQETIQLTGSKAHRKSQIVQSVQKSKPEVKAKDISVPNL